MSITRHHVGPRMSQISVHNGVIYLAGQIPKNSRGGDIGEQTREVLEIIDALLHEAGSDKSRLLFCQIFLRDLTDFAGMNEVWERWVVPGATPGRATVEAALVTGPCRIEIVATAAAAP